MRTAAVSIGVIAAIVVIAAYVYVMRSNERSAAQLRDDFIKLQTKVETAAASQKAGMASAALISRLAADATASAAALPGTASPAESSGRANPTPATPEEFARASNEQHEKLATQFDEALSLDGYDRTWGAPMVDTIHSVFPTLQAGRLAKAECASRLCRLTIEHSSRAEQRSLAQQMSTATAVSGEAFFRYDKESNPLRTTVYLAREGTELLSVVKDL